jgi:hypothetical protein
MMVGAPAGRRGESPMAEGNERPWLPVGARVVDSEGEPVGTIRAVYPHYVAVEGRHDSAYRVPFRAIDRFEGNTVTLRVGRDALDPMGSERDAAYGLPEHGGHAPEGTGSGGPSQAAAGFDLGGHAIGDGRPGDMPAEEAAALAEALDRAESDDLEITERMRPGADEDEANADTGASYGTDVGN